MIDYIYNGSLPYIGCSVCKFGWKSVPANQGLIERRHVDASSSQCLYSSAKQSCVDVPAAGVDLVQSLNSTVLN